MKGRPTKTIAIAVVSVVVAAGALLAQSRPNDAEKQSSAKALPPPRLAGHMTLEESVASRRSVRSFSDRPLNLEEIGQLCWAGQGTTEPKTGRRAAPSAGALYPMEIYVVTAEGVDHYVPQGHQIERHAAGDLRRRLQHAAMEQDSVGSAPACFVLTAVVERTARKYGARAELYCWVEAGHVAQNILLQATAMDLGGVPIGAFDDRKVAKALRLPDDRRVLYLLPVGHAR